MGDNLDYSLFEIDKFDFLRLCVAQRAQKTFSTLPLKVTCFDVNKSVFIFGSNIGVIYGFKRGQRKSKGAFLKSRIVTAELSHVRLISSSLLLAVSRSGVYLLNWANMKYLYGWNGENGERAHITAVECGIMDEEDEEQMMFVSGDSAGVIRSHDVVRKECHVIWREEGDHEIVQMQFIDTNTLVICTCFRTFILNLSVNDLRPQETLPIGRNARKQCGKYGGVYAATTNTIYASRPSMHIIKAESLNGNVLETFILKNALQPKKLHMFDEFRSVRYSNASLKLGYLQLFCDEQFLISWNDCNLIIMQANQGQLCVKEENLYKIVDLKVTKGNDGEMFLLFENRDLIRIRVKSRIVDEIPIQLDEENDDEDDSISIHSTESMINLMLPINFNEFHYVKDEVIKVLGKIQDNVTQKFDKISSSIIGILDSSNSITSSSSSHFDTTVTNSSDMNDISDVCSERSTSTEVMNGSYGNVNQRNQSNETDQEPLVIRRKKKVEKVANKKPERNASSDDHVLVQSRKLSKSNSKVATRECNEAMQVTNKGEDDSSLTNPKVDCDIESTETTVTEEHNEEYGDDHLMNILKKYKEAKGISTSASLASLEQHEGSTEDSLLFQAIESSLNPNVDEQQENSLESNLSSLASKKDNDLEASSNTESKSAKKSKCLMKNFTWEMSIGSTNSSNQSGKLLSLCATGYNSEKSIGLVWLVKNKSNTTSLIYYPTFDELKLSRVKITQVASSYNSLFALCHDGIIYRRDGIDATRPLGNKWIRLPTNVLKHNIICMSYSMINSIMWCCDEKGEVWILKSKQLKWTRVKNCESDNEIQLRKVSVSPNNCSMVWAIDINKNVYVREGIFCDDEDDLLMGISWLKVECLSGVIDIAVCDDAVWVILEDKKLYRRNGICTPDDYVGDSWEMIVGPTLINDHYAAISASANNEIWILTESGCVYHNYISKPNKSDEVDDWLII